MLIIGNYNLKFNVIENMKNDMSVNKDDNTDQFKDLKKATTKYGIKSGEITDGASEYVDEQITQQKKKKLTSFKWKNN